MSSLAGGSPTAVPADLGDVQLIALVLGMDPQQGQVRSECHALIERLGGLERAARMAVPELASALAGSPSVGPRGALLLAAALELGRRGMREALPLGTVVREASDLEPHLRGYFAGARKEVFLVVLLDAKNRPVRVERVSEGCLTWSVVHPREVFAPAVREGAGAVIVAHNHPSGDPEPSRQDLEVTDRLHRVGALLGIPLLDHIVVGAGRCVSLRARRQLTGA